MRTISSEIVIFCTTRGIRRPGKKLLVADYLQKLNDYTCVSNVYVALRNNGVKISPATVYQSLNWLIEHGFAEFIPDEDSSRRENMFRISCDNDGNAEIIHLKSKALSTSET